MNILIDILDGTKDALAEVGRKDIAQKLDRIGDLGDKAQVERTLHMVQGLGLELVEAYVKAGKFIRRAPPGIRKDAVKYQADLFTARCYVSALQGAARRTLKGTYQLN